MHMEYVQSKKPRRDAFIDFKGGTASVSRSTGNLTILNFRAAAEGTYKCHPTGHRHYEMELKCTGEFIMLVCQTHHTRSSVSYVLYVDICSEADTILIPRPMLESYTLGVVDSVFLK